MTLNNSSTNSAPPTWDDTRPVHWPEAFIRVEIRSTVDGHAQPAFFYPSEQANRPLVVSLHTWSADYQQVDPLAAQCHALDWNYIHPNFRGPNNQPQAGGSHMAISDIDDAIELSLRNGKVDPAQIHIIGVSGGGHAAMAMYLRSRYEIASFAAWVGISDLEDWYHESRGRGQRYADDILKLTSASGPQLNVEEARKRSPLHMPTADPQRQPGRLLLFAGIHDGYKGSVPITHTLNFYNRVVRSSGGGEEALVSQKDMLELVTKRCFPGGPTDHYIAGRKVHYAKSFNDTHLCIFEGGHEMLVPVALDHIAGPQTPTILTIGDSNGAAADGWVSQLKALRPQDLILNCSVSGNTIGFDNLGTSGLNTLSNIERYLNEAQLQAGGRSVNTIIVNLGTNDCKAEFDSRIMEVPANLDRLMATIRSFKFAQQDQPGLIIVSPPPYGDDAGLQEKYRGGDARVRSLLPAFAEIAMRHQAAFIDIYDPLKPVFKQLAPDGVHMAVDGQKIIATILDQALSN